MLKASDYADEAHQSGHEDNAHNSTEPLKPGIDAFKKSVEDDKKHSGSSSSKPHPEKDTKKETEVGTHDSKTDKKNAGGRHSSKDAKHHVVKMKGTEAERIGLDKLREEVEREEDTSWLQQQQPKPKPKPKKDQQQPKPEPKKEKPKTVKIGSGPKGAGDVNKGLQTLKEAERHMVSDVKDASAHKKQNDKSHAPSTPTGKNERKLSGTETISQGLATLQDDKHANPNDKKEDESHEPSTPTGKLGRKLSGTETISQGLATLQDANPHDTKEEHAKDEHAKPHDQKQDKSHAPSTPTAKIDRDLSGSLAISQGLATLQDDKPVHLQDHKQEKTHAPSTPTWKTDKKLSGSKAISQGLATLQDGEHANPHDRKQDHHATPDDKKHGASKQKKQGGVEALRQGIATLQDSAQLRDKEKKQTMETKEKKDHVASESHKESVTQEDQRHSEIDPKEQSESADPKHGSKSEDGTQAEVEPKTPPPEPSSPKQGTAIDDERQQNDKHHPESVSNKENLPTCTEDEKLIQDTKQEKPAPDKEQMDALAAKLEAGFNKSAKDGSLHSTLHEVCSPQPKLEDRLHSSMTDAISSGKLTSALAEVMSDKREDVTKLQRQDIVPRNLNDSLPNPLNADSESKAIPVQSESKADSESKAKQPHVDVKADTGQGVLDYLNADTEAPVTKQKSKSKELPVNVQVRIISAKHLKLPSGCFGGFGCGGQHHFFCSVRPVLGRWQKRIFTPAKPKVQHGSMIVWDTLLDLPTLGSGDSLKFSIESQDGFEYLGHAVLENSMWKGGFKGCIPLEFAGPDAELHLELIVGSTPNDPTGQPPQAESSFITVSILSLSNMKKIYKDAVCVCHVPETGVYAQTQKRPSIRGTSARETVWLDRLSLRQDTSENHPLHFDIYANSRSKQRLAHFQLPFDKWHPNGYEGILCDVQEKKANADPPSLAIAVLVPAKKEEVPKNNASPVHVQEMPKNNASPIHVQENREARVPVAPLEESLTLDKSEMSMSGYPTPMHAPMESPMQEAGTTASVTPGQTYRFVASSGYTYPAGALHGEMVKVLEIDPTSSPPVLVRWDNGFTYSVHYENLQSLKERTKIGLAGASGYSSGKLGSGQLSPLQAPEESMTQPLLASLSVSGKLSLGPEPPLAPTETPIARNASKSRVQDSGYKAEARSYGDLLVEVETLKKKLQDTVKKESNQVPARAGSSGYVSREAKGGYKRSKQPDILGMLFLRHDKNLNGRLDPPEMQSMLHEVFGHALTKDVMQEVLKDFPNGISRLTPSGNLCMDLYRLFDRVDQQLAPLGRSTSSKNAA